MRLTASQLRHIIREELSESRRNPADRFKVGNEGFETQAEAEAYADKIAGESGWESDVNVVDTSTDMAVYTAEEGAKGKLIDEVIWSSRSDTAGDYGNWTGFTPMDAEKLAKELATKSPRRRVSYGDMQDLIAAAKKFTSSQDAKKGIIEWLANKGYGQRADYR